MLFTSIKPLLACNPTDLYEFALMGLKGHDDILSSEEGRRKPSPFTIGLPVSQYMCTCQELIGFLESLTKEEFANVFDEWKAEDEKEDTRKEGTDNSCYTSVWRASRNAAGLMPKMRKRNRTSRF